jgi:hypothetical protein
MPVREQSVKNRRQSAINRYKSRMEKSRRSNKKQFRHYSRRSPPLKEGNLLKLMQKPY